MVALGDRIEAYRGAHILCAVSGGVDSIALLLLLAEAREKYAIRLTAAHFEHGIRGEASREDARFVESFCERLKVPCFTGAGDVPSLARESGKGIEEAARDARYRFLRDQKARTGADYIALAHHADDQMETVLMHLCRGSGLSGVCGMRPRDGDLLRLLLDFRKEELLEYVRSRGMSWREDATNARADTPRNALRLKVIPALESIYPGCVGAVNRFSSIAREEDDFLRSQAHQWLSSHCRPMPFGWSVELGDRPHSALFLRALHQMLPSCGYDALRRAAALAERSEGAVALPGGHRFERGAKRLSYIHAGFRKRREVLPLEENVFLPGVGGVSVRPCAPVPVKDDFYRQAVRAAALEGACVRTRRTGDRFQPFGMSGMKDLSDYLIDRKIDRPLRDALLLIARGDEVLLIAGVGISEKLRLRENEPAVEILFTGDKLLP